LANVCDKMSMVYGETIQKGSDPIRSNRLVRAKACWQQWGRTPSQISHRGQKVETAGANVNRLEAENSDIFRENPPNAAVRASLSRQADRHSALRFSRSQLTTRGTPFSMGVFGS